MGRPTEATDEMVIDAGRRIMTDNLKVTGDRLRQYVGHGLPRRMALVWQAHIEATAVVVAAPPPSDLPGALSDVRDAMHKRVGTLVDDMVTCAWKAADDLAQQRTRAEHDEARRKMADYEDERETADANLAAVDEKLASATDEIQGLRGELDAAKVNLVRMQERLDGATEQAKDLRTELADVSRELATTAARFAAASTDASREREARERAEELMADMIQRTAAKAPSTRSPGKGPKSQAVTTT